MTSNNNISYSIVADLHCDAVLQMIRGYDISKKHKNYHIDIPRLKEGGVNLQVFACLANPYINGKSVFDMVNEYISCLKTEFSRNADQITVCQTSDAALQAKRENKIAAVLAIEGGTTINNRIDNIKYFHDKGVRLLTLVHEQSTDWCLSWSDKEPAFQGLTELGRDIIAEMNRVGMIVDISHCAASSANAAIEASQMPPVASHSCVDSICPSGRNLNDKQIKAIANKGGAIGITFVYFILSSELNMLSAELRSKYPDELKRVSEMFVSIKPEEELQKEMKKQTAFIEKFESPLNPLRPTVQTVVDHIEYIINLGGIECAAIGSDFDGMSMPPVGLEDCTGLPNIITELQARGHKENDIDKIMGGNFMRVFKEVCG